MSEIDLEGSLVLEKLAEIGQLEAFYEAVDSDDLERAAKLLKRAHIPPEAVAAVLQQMADGD